MEHIFFCVSWLLGDYVPYADRRQIGRVMVEELARLAGLKVTPNMRRDARRLPNPEWKGKYKVHRVR